MSLPPGLNATMQRTNSWCSQQPSPIWNYLVLSKKKFIKISRNAIAKPEHLHLCVLTNRESNGDVHLNNNYCFRCRLPSVADAKNSDRCIRQFDDLLLKFHRLSRGRKKVFQSRINLRIKNYLEFERFDESFFMLWWPPPPPPACKLGKSFCRFFVSRQIR